MLRIVFLIMLSLLLSACAAPPFNAHEHPLEPTLRQWQPEEPPRAVILALHSFGDFSAAYDQLGPWFADAGIYLESYDQAGFGARQFEGRWAGETRLVEEAARRIEQLSSAYHQPVFVMGESLGGAVAILAALEQPDRVAGLILSGPAVREGIRLRYGWNLAIASAATLAPGYRVSVERNPDNPLLSPHSAQRLAYDDRVMREVRLDSYWGLIKLADTASDQVPALTQWDIPVLLLYGEKDQSVPAAGIQALRTHLQGQVHYHQIEQGPHLLLQGKQWPATSQLILQWLEEQANPHPVVTGQKITGPSTNRLTIGPASQLQHRSD